MKLKIEIECDNDAMQDVENIEMLLDDLGTRLNLSNPGPYNIHDHNGNWVGKAWFEEEK